MVYLTFEKESLLAVFMTNLISYSDFYRFLIFLKQNFIKFLLLFSLTKPLWYFYQPYAAAPLGNQDLSFHQTAIWLVSKITNQNRTLYCALAYGKRTVTIKVVIIREFCSLFLTFRLEKDSNEWHRWELFCKKFADFGFQVLINASFTRISD